MSQCVTVSCIVLPWVAVRPVTGMRVHALSTYTQTHITTRRERLWLCSRHLCAISSRHILANTRILHIYVKESTHTHVRHTATHCNHRHTFIVSTLWRAVCHAAAESKSVTTNILYCICVPFLTIHFDATNERPLWTCHTLRVQMWTQHTRSCLRKYAWMQHNAAYCNTLWQYLPACRRTIHIHVCKNMCAAVCYRVLQYVAVCCSVLQGVIRIPNLYVNAWTYIYIRILKKIYYMCMYIHIYVYIYTHSYRYVYVNRRIYICVYIYVYIRVYKYVYIYIYKCIYIHMYIYTYIYI